MSTAAVLLVAFVIALGVVGTVVPGVPGLPLAWVAVLAWTLLDGGGFGHWVVLLIVTLLMVGGIAAKYVLSERRMRRQGAPRRTLVVAALGGLLGFFLVPVIGVFLGLAVGALLAEYARLHELRAAWASTRGVLVALGIGTLIEIAAGVAMALTWTAGALLG